MAREAAKQENAKKASRRAGPRPFWSGTLTFGLVSVPVEIHAAHRSSRVSLRTLSPEGHPLRRRYVCPEHGPLERDEIVRGHAIDGDRYVTVSDEEIEALQPERSREIDLRRFAPRDAIDPIYCDRAYFLLPPDEVSKPYRLLAAIMERTGRAGLATFVMRGKAYVVAIFAERGVLRAETLRDADAVRSVADVGLGPVGEADAARVEALRDAIRAGAADAIDPDELRDLDAELLRARAQEKAAAGEGLVEAPEAEEENAEDEAEETGGEVVDIMALLKARLGRGEKGRTDKGRTERGRGSGDDLGALSKRELYARAQAREIEGRSRMSKDELIEALAG